MSSSHTSSSPQSIHEQPRQRRHSNIYNSFQDILNAGGKNSLNSFASSYSRSRNFINADFDTHHRPSISYGTHEESPLLSTTRSNTSERYVESAIAEESDLISDSMSMRSYVLRDSGQSTAPQTIFNGINTLIGIGILSLPLGLYYSGWIFGTLILFSCALTTQFTAKLLARCMKKNEELETYGDIAQYTFGNIAHFIVVATFSIDLLSAGISMIIIFADSFNAITGINKLVFKSVISIIFFLLSFVRLNLLSHLSFLGIICTSMIVLVVLVSGLLKIEGPGSLIDISPTSLWPSNLTHLFLSVGIFMSPFGGHAIFPELYKDMKTPSKYDKSCTTIFSFTVGVDYIMASLGYVMFGSGISDQVTKSILTNSGSPQWIQLVICILMGVLPISKGPLITRPIITMIDQFFPKQGLPIKIANRFAVVSVFFITSLIFTDFGKIMSFLGSAICFAICVIFPLSFYLKLYYDDISSLGRSIYVCSIVLAISLAIGGTLAVLI